MNLLTVRSFFVCLILVFSILGPAPDAYTESIVNCHCFTDRSYNPAARFAADDYILASSFNSLLSKFYGIPKRQIVMIKMDEGVVQDDLLISLQLAKRTGIDSRKFLKFRREKKIWATIISGLAPQEAIMQDKILQALKSGMPAQEAAVMVADEIIGEFNKVTLGEIKQLRKSGLNEKEITLLFILAHKSSIQPEALLEQYKKQGRSWSEIAYNLGLEPEMAGKLILAYPDKQIPR